MAANRYYAVQPGALALWCDLKEVDMDFANWSERDEFLNRLKRAIEQRTHGRLTGLSFEAEGDETFIEVASPNYYGVQLVIAARNNLLNCCAEPPVVAIRFLVDNHSFQVRIPAKRVDVPVRTHLRPMKRKELLGAGRVAVAAT